jgi:hypothetical protein
LVIVIYFYSGIVKAPALSNYFFGITAVENLGVLTSPFKNIFKVLIAGLEIGIKLISGQGARLRAEHGAGQGAGLRNGLEAMFGATLGLRLVAAKG